MSADRIALTNEVQQDVWRLRQQGFNRLEIQQKTGLTWAQVAKCLTKHETALKPEFLEQVLQIKLAQTARLMELHRDAYDEYQRSKELFHQRTESRESGRVHVQRGQRGRGDEAAENDQVIPLPDAVTVQEIERTSIGQAALLHQAVTCLSEVRKIWGLDAATKLDHTSDGKPLKIYIGVDVDEV